MSKHKRPGYVVRCGCCGRPTADDASMCTTCAGHLRNDLRGIGWLTAELDITCSGQRAARYAPMSRVASAAVEPDWHAVRAREALSGELSAMVGHCVRRRGRYVRNDEQPAPGDMPAQARWLMARVPALALDPSGPSLAHALARAIIRAKGAIDLRPERQYLGDCPTCLAPQMYAEPGAPLAHCRACDATADADSLRAVKLAELDDRLCTAAEIADLSTYLGLRANREQVRKRINTWHARGMVTAAETRATDSDPRFRFGAVWALLAAGEAHHAAS